MILRYIYGGRLSLEEYDTSHIIKILIAAKLISYEPEKIFNSIDFISLTEKSLISIIQNDNFQMNVIQVWEHVLKWGIAKNPGLPSDPSNYSKDEFITLRDQPNNKLESKIITKEINPKSIDSRIITNQHAELISKWIDKLEITDNMKNSYEFNRVKNDEYKYATSNRINHGPSFYNDLFLYDPYCGFATPSGYEKPINKVGFFYVEEYEIFQIMKD
ncbi:BTB/POZ protein [Rhizophagus irregularis DAOM 181602=DAOM 197198]|nr:BTB/POZ protein [Rhizophagus irregularis DAOM 181602=DAOM 197198]